jgi:hypothetical protein
MEGKGSQILIALPLRRSRVEWGNQVSVFQLCSGEAVSSPGIPRSLNSYITGGHERQTSPNERFLFETIITS